MENNAHHLCLKSCSMSELMTYISKSRDHYRQLHCLSPHVYEEGLTKMLQNDVYSDSEILLLQEGNMGGSYLRCFWKYINPENPKKIYGQCTPVKTTLRTTFNGIEFADMSVGDNVDILDSKFTIVEKVKYLAVCKRVKI